MIFNFYRYLTYGLNESVVKAQDVSYIFSYVSNYNSIGRYLAWGFMKEKWNIIEERYAQQFLSSHSQLFPLKATITATTTPTAKTKNKLLFHFSRGTFSRTVIQISQTILFKIMFKFLMILISSEFFIKEQSFANVLQNRCP